MLLVYIVSIGYRGHIVYIRYRDIDDMTEMYRLFRLGHGHRGVVLRRQARYSGGRRRPLPARARVDGGGELAGAG